MRAVVFDVDGTLYSQPALRQAMAARLVQSALARPREGLTVFRALRAYRRAQERLRGVSVEGAIDAAQVRIAGADARLPESVVARIVATWMEEAPLAVLARLADPSLRGLLEGLRSRGVRLGVLSDYPAAAKLRALGVDAHFDVVVSAQDVAVNRFKPHPAGLLEALRRLGVEPDAALYVGDREDVDAATARAAGVACVILGRPRRGRRASAALCTVAADFRELHAVLLPGPAVE